MVKLEAFKEIKDDDEYKRYYQNLFGNVKGIWVEIPDGDPDFEIYGSKDTSGGVYSVPVSVYYSESREYKIGVLKIRGEI